MKKVIAILVCFTLLISAGACSTQVPQVSGPTGTIEATESTTEPEKKCSTPILYRVTDGDGHILYLLGSIHAGTQEMYPLPEYVLDAYESADVLALEAHSSNATLADLVQYNQAIRLEDGTTIRDCVSEQTYTEALQILKENNAYKEGLEQCQPIYWYQTIDQLLDNKGDASSTLGVDVTLERMAKQDGKPMAGVESLGGRVAFYMNMSMEMQRMILEWVVTAYHDPAVTQMREDVCKTWADGDLSAFNTLLVNDPFRLGMTAEDLAQCQEFYDAIKTKRDLVMVQYVKDALASGQTVFVCVGIAHVIGDDGIVDQLIQAGYTVERI